MKFTRISWWAGLGLASALCVGTILHADDDKPAKAADKPEAKAEAKAEAKPEAKAEHKSEIRVVAIPSAGKHWIGIFASPVDDEALRSQLGLKGDRLIVVRVAPESPSAKAGVKQHDILIKFGDKEINK